MKFKLDENLSPALVVAFAAAGIVVLRLQDQSHPSVERAAASLLEMLSRERLTGQLWIVEPGRIRIHD